MQVKGYVGSANYFDNQIDGQVNGLLGRRSPGSALKPFIYALAIDEGLIHPRTMLKDTAIRIAAYNPENFDHDFLGPIDATSALVRSRNVPAIEVANMLPPPGLYGFLQEGRHPQSSRREFLRSRARAWRRRSEYGGDGRAVRDARQRRRAPAAGHHRDAAASQSARVRMLSPEASYAVLEMLRKNPRPSDDFSLSQVPSTAAIPWKTGTSFGSRDAWAVGIVGPYVLGVWIGNFDGTPNANFIGRDAAGPLFFQIVDALRARGPLREVDRSRPSESEEDQGVRAFGSASRAVLHPFQGDAFHSRQVADHDLFDSSRIRDRPAHRSSRLPRQQRPVGEPGLRVLALGSSEAVSLRRTCAAHAAANGSGLRKVRRDGAAPLISSPSRGIVYSTARGGRTEIPFAAVTDADSRVVYWFVDDQLVGTARRGESLFWKAKPGTFLVRAVDEQGRAAAQQISVVPLER